MLKPSLASISPLLQKTFLATSLSLLIVTLFIGIRLLMIAYPGLQGMRFSSLSLMALGPFVMSTISFLACYFVVFRTGRRLHRAFTAALLSLIFVLTYELFMQVAFAASVFPLFVTPWPINPYEIIAVVTTVLLLIVTVILLRSLKWISMPPTAPQLRALGVVLGSLFVISQLAQTTLSHPSHTSLVGGVLATTVILFALSYASARHRKSRQPFFQSVIAVAIAVQLLLIFSAVYTTWSIAT